METVKTQHTPTPWKVKGLVIYAEKNAHIADYDSHHPNWINPEDVANAEYVVRAVNSHEELLEAVKTFDRLLSKGANALDHSDLDALRKARVIIAKAEGKS